MTYEVLDSSIYREDISRRYVSQTRSSQLCQGAVAAHRPLDRAVVDPSVGERGQHRPLAAQARHLRGGEHVQPAWIAAVRVGDGLLLHHRVVLVDRVLEGVRV